MQPDQENLNEDDKKPQPHNNDIEKDLDQDIEQLNKEPATLQLEEHGLDDEQEKEQLNFKPQSPQKVMTKPLPPIVDETKPVLSQAQIDKDQQAKNERVKQFMDKNKPNFFVHGKKLKLINKALFIFGVDSKIRQHAVWLAFHKWFDRILTLCIMINAINIAAADYSWRKIPNGVEPEVGFRYVLGKIITIIFIFEFLVKIVALGFVMHESSYINNGWNKLDFVVVVTGVWSLLGGKSYGAIRTIRLLRPLRSINKLRQLRVIVHSLLLSLPPLGNVAVFLSFIIILFGTFGLHLFSGMYEYRCRLTPEPIGESWPILEGHHFLCNPDDDLCPKSPVMTYCGAPFDKGIPWNSSEIQYAEFNYGYTGFDNILVSMQTIFESMTGEGWSFMMYIMWHRFGSWVVVSFFTLLIIFGVFFVLNLFLAVISDSFDKVNQEEDNKEYRSAEDKSRIISLFQNNPTNVVQSPQNSQRKLEEEQDFLLKKVKSSNKSNLKTIKEKSEVEGEMADVLELDQGNEVESSSSSSGDEMPSDSEDQQKKKIENWATKVIESAVFQTFSFLLIFGNTIILAMEDEQNTISLNDNLLSFNRFFTYIFTVEMCFKIGAYGIKGYVRDGFNSFDGTLVIISLFDLALSAFSDGDGNGLGVLTAFRTLRLLRVVKLATRSEGIMVLLTAIAQTLKDIGYFGLLLLLYLFICALLGMEFFAEYIKFDDLDSMNPVVDSGVSPRLNFDTFPQAMVTTFALLVNEDWNWVLYYYIKQCEINPNCPAWLAWSYIMFVVIIGNFILLQLFLAILIDNFSEASEQAILDKKEKMVQEAQTKEQEQISRQKSIADGVLNKQKSSSFMFNLKKMFNKDALTKNQEEAQKRRQRAELKAKYDPLCMSAYQESGMDLKQSSVLSDPQQDENEPYTATRKILYLIMQRRKESFYNGIINLKVKSAEDLEPQGKSLCMMGATDKIRIFFFNIVQKSSFENTVVFVILISTFSLIFQSPLKDPNDSDQQMWQTIDMITTIIFTGECLFKIFAYGFLCNGKTSYLRSFENIFDFIIVIFALSNIVLKGSSMAKSMSKLKTLRILRVVRPLRIISRSEQLKIAINALMKSIPQLINLIIFCVLFFFLFGILGVNSLKGAYYECLTDHIDSNFVDSVASKWDCMDLGGDWIIRDSNFDNIYQAMSTMFKVSLTEGWLNIMYWGRDQQGPDMIEKRDSSMIWAAYYSLFIVVGAFFLLNLFDGIVIDNFNKERQLSLGIGDFTSGQRLWIQLQAYVGNQKPKIEQLKPEDKSKAMVYDFCTSTHFEAFILALIIINMIVFMLFTPRQSDATARLFEDINLLFLIIFCGEAMMKIYSMGWRYFKDSYNTFDFTIISITLVSMFLSMVVNLDLGNQTSILRVFRLGRVLRLINKAASLRMIFNTFLITLPALGNIGMLLLLIAFIYSILGVELFAYVKWQSNITLDANFQTFSTSFLTLFRCSTGEGWNFIMDDMIRLQQPNHVCNVIDGWDEYVKYGNTGCGSSNAYWYMISFQFFFAIIVINLFVAVILEGFDESSRLEEANLSEFYLETFKKKWGKFDKDATALISIKDLIKFLAQIELPFTDQKSQGIYMCIMKMYLPIIQKIPLENAGPNQKIKAFFLFQDVLAALTHLSTENNIRDSELRKMNMMNLLQKRVYNQRTRQLQLVEGYEQIPYDSSHYILVRIIAKVFLKQRRKAGKKRRGKEKPAFSKPDGG